MGAKKYGIAGIGVVVLAAVLYFLVLFPSSSANRCGYTVGTYPTDMNLASNVRNHTHYFCANNSVTTDYCYNGFCHNHRIDAAGNVAEPAGGFPHIHQLFAGQVACFIDGKSNNEVCYP